MCEKHDKEYFTVSELMEQAIALAKNDPRYAEAEAKCVLDYCMVAFDHRQDIVKLCEFDVIGFPDYGGSEGIYGSIFFRGEWLPEQRNGSNVGRMRVYALKTLSDDKDAYLAMGALVSLICYYAMEFIRTHLDRFD